MPLNTLPCTSPFVQNEEFIILEKEIIKSNNGNDFLKLKLSNSLEIKNGYCFSDIDIYYSVVKKGDKVAIWGKYNKKNSKYFLNINKLKVVGESRNDTWSRFETIIKEIKNEYCRKIIDKFLIDEIFVKKFKSAPASLYNHHCYRGGLLLHTTNSMEMGINLIKGSEYEGKINKDILITGLFLHDIGKIYMYKDNSITDYGKYIGHITLGFLMFTKKIENMKIPFKLKAMLANIILSHHYTKNNSSETRPETIEARLVNKIESINAELDFIP